MALTFTALALVAPAVSSRAAAQIPCTLCEDIPPEWADYVVSSQHTSFACGEARGEPQPSVEQPSNDSAPPDARSVAAAVALAFRHVPREMAGEPSAEPLLDEVRVVHETDTEAIVMVGPAFDSALKAAGVQYQAHIYPGTQHGFHNNSTPRYNEPAARLSWERTIAFFKANLA
jgi:Dienelactone hydrolase family